MAGLLANVAPYFLFAVGEHLTSSAHAGILDGTTPLWTALTMAAVMSLVLVPIDGGRIGSVTPTALLAVLVLGVAGTGLAYVLNYALLNAEGPTAPGALPASRCRRARPRGSAHRGRYNRHQRR